MSGVRGAVRHHIDCVHASSVALADEDLKKARALDCEKLLFRERILEASKFIVGSSFSGPGNEASH